MDFHYTASIAASSLLWVLKKQLAEAALCFSLPGADPGPPTHGVSSMTLHTVAMVLRQSVVFSMGRFLFCWYKKGAKGENPVRSSWGVTNLAPV